VSFTALILGASLAGQPISMAPGFAPNEAIGFSHDARGNRVITEGAVTASSGGFFTPHSRGQSGGGQATALGNLINVTVYGNNNTVVVRAKQINFGNQSAALVPVTPSGTAVSDPAGSALGGGQ